MPRSLRIAAFPTMLLAGAAALFAPCPLSAQTPANPLARIPVAISATWKSGDNGMGDQIAYQVREQLSKSSRFRYVDDDTRAVYELEIAGMPINNGTQEILSVVVVRRYLFSHQKIGPYKATAGDSPLFDTSAVEFTGSSHLSAVPIDMVSDVDEVATSDIKAVLARLHATHGSICNPLVFKTNKLYSYLDQYVCAQE